jgi:hypothetical protein
MLLTLVTAVWSIAAVAPVESLRCRMCPRPTRVRRRSGGDVFRYWGDAHAGVAQFGALVERRAGGAAGIAANVLTRAVVDRGWQTGPPPTSLEALRDTTSKGAARRVLPQIARPLSLCRRVAPTPARSSSRSSWSFAGSSWQYSNHRGGRAAWSLVVVPSAVGGASVPFLPATKWECPPAHAA